MTRRVLAQPGDTTRQLQAPLPGVRVRRAVEGPLPPRHPTTAHLLAGDAITNAVRRIWEIRVNVRDLTALQRRATRRGRRCRPLVGNHIAQRCAEPQAVGSPEPT